MIKVESFSGDVVLERDDSKKDIFKNMNLKTKDVITTAEAYYSEEGEIVIKYAFNVVAIDTLEPEQFTKYAYLLLDETGKYVLDHIE